ncbi:MAG: ImmA/IrrE family metallo-endopeptidase [Propionibacteriaceae bacterium]|jgi:Zn-dependent peptidase ImmA (M78 family)|nr:ImmA/IrrE family metallo-endopeptidase [Propionibacteriaceae bacterium]
MTRLIKDVAREDAVRILDQYWDGRYPVDPVRIAQGIGIRVWTADLPVDVSGQLIKSETDAVGNIYLNQTETAVRQHFTCAHEIGHWVDRKNHHDLKYSFVDYRDASKAPAVATEWYADHFAGNLLMPTEDFTRFHKMGFSVPDLAFYFGVSPASVKVRLRSLSLA